MYCQISDMMQEFLCLSDQARLVDIDNQRIKELTDHSLQYEQIHAYCERVINQCFAYKKGIGRFKIGGELDISYLEQRSKLIESHAEAYGKLQQQADKYHMGCLNGTVLKEIVVYRPKGYAVQSRRARNHKRPIVSRYHNIDETPTEEYEDSLNQGCPV